MISDSQHQRLLAMQYRAHLRIDKTYPSTEPEDRAPRKPSVKRAQNTLSAEFATMDQIAEKLGVDRQTVLRTLHSALRKMRVALRKFNEEV